MCFVFFFKQKTAYEMRISDWSSDVCSSDLQASMNAAKVQLRAMTAQQIQLYTAITSFPQMLTALTRTADKFPAYSATISNVPGPREQMYWNGARLDGMCPASIPVDGMAMNITQVSNFRNIDFGITRSEEHTSELQSLMRISYAGFC